MPTTIQDRTIGIGHNNPPAFVAAAPWLAGRKALIRRQQRLVETSGRAREGTWVLTFARETPPEIEPLMGWTGGSDPLATDVRLTFPTRAQAIAYAERQGLDYDAEPEPAAATRKHPDGRRRPERAPLRVVLGRKQAPAAPPGFPDGPDLERALVNPAAVFATPAAVLDHPRMLREGKREILRRWAWDEYLKEVAAAEGMAEGEPSQLEAVKAALLALGETWRPKPSAPAVAVPVPQQEDSEDMALAA
ncbi:NADH dehydrogenase ubiquinone Fe-S protein 4 [Methylobacterium pseudosasicola]|uniref:ETC complex I subunit conserved region n=1 Tax=Methylobacterium pseudosasicola TaxID=582667 RepID=A0A1I4S2Z6_9HYPH|nr:NADH dehydrogenase ubiquinone Fe-S protein 4 [Methylobacterium pseudosasicola]SFM58674.1 ETC complex I subunit conserved region [Methylobacterium pseudosasicola]